MKELTKSLATIQTKMKAKKSSYNSFGKYYFRKSEDILEAIKPFLLEHGVYVTVNEEIVATDPVPTLQSTATISNGKDAIHATALVGVDLNQKGMQTAQQFGAASSYGKKYALGNLFLIDDTQDSDAANTHDKKPATKSKIASSNDAAYTKAVDYIKGGGKLDAIKQKYDLAPNVEVALQKL